MEPEIRYCTTSDGVNIAYCTLGEGSPYVFMPSQISNLQLEWQFFPEVRAFHEGLARTRRLVRYDCRGSGLSDRDATDYSLDSLVLDLEAVVERLGLQRFALCGPFDLGPAAIAYTVRNAERVSHLILWVTYARASDAYATPEAQAWVALRDKDWRTFTETVAHIFYGWSEVEQAARFAAYMRESTTPEAVQAFAASLGTFDVTELLSQVRPPTLVIQRRSAVWPHANAARVLAAQIPDARLMALDSASLIPSRGQVGTLLRAIGEFLGDRPDLTSVAAHPSDAVSGLVTILFTDLASSTALTQRLGDAKAQELVRAHNAIVREALAAHGGSEIKHTGDGIMASFPTASGALECAVAIQRAVGARDDADLQVHIGLNAGEPVAEESDLFGTSVQLARRICDHARAGQVLVSNVVRELAAGKGFLFADIGEVVPKGFEEPVRLYEVRWRAEESPQRDDT